MMISAMALILVAASGVYDSGMERLRTMPAAERTRLLDSLRNFDRNLTPEQQAAARELDRRLSELSPDQRAQYLTILRRYHAWLKTLPEQRQEELAAKPASERIALVRSLIRERPVPVGETPPNLRVLEPGEYSPFEVASAYKIWQVLTERQLADIEKAKTDHARREMLFRFGERRKEAIPRETTPPDFDEERALAAVKEFWGPLRVLAMMEAPAKAKIDEVVKKRIDAIRPEIQRRQAINLFVSQAKVRSVEPERLVRFIDSLPPWIPSTFDSLSPDEARRRLAFAYRLVFPDSEIGAVRKPAGAAAKGHPTPSAKTGAPPRAKRKAADDGQNEAPF